MAILFSTRVKIGEEAGPGLKKNLENLLASSSSALRVECLKENGVEVFYIRDRNIFDYLWENLDAYESQLRDMRTRARVALELKIRPFIEGDVFQDGKLVPLWKAIEKRILEDNSTNGRQPFFHKISDFLLGSEKTVDRLASIPDGLSLANCPRSAFIAGVAFGFNQGEGLNSGKPMHVGYSDGPMVSWPPAAKIQLHEAKQIKQFYLNALNELQTKNLSAFSSILITPTPHPLEEDGKLADEHAKGFLMAAKEYMEKNKGLKKTVSLLIVAESAAWYQKLRNEMLEIGCCTRNSRENAVQDKQSSVLKSPQGFDSVSKLWDKSFKNKGTTSRQIDFSNISDDDALF